MNPIVQGVALIVAVVMLIGGAVALKRLGEIHVLVNSRLTEALNDIAALKNALVVERRKEKP